MRDESTLISEAAMLVLDSLVPLRPGITVERSGRGRVDMDKLAGFIGLATPCGVAKVVKVGAETLLVIELNEGTDLPEGEIAIKSIEVVSGPGGPPEAMGCQIQW